MKPFMKDKEEDDHKREQTMKGRLSERIDVLKRQLAGFLGRQSERLSSRQQKLMLLVFGVLMGGMSLTLIIRPFQNSPARAFGIPEGMETKAFILPPGERDAVFSEEDYLMLLKFKSTLDSLYKTDRSIYDELLHGREGLLDSINFLISIYK